MNFLRAISPAFQRDWNSIQKPSVLHEGYLFPTEYAERTISRFGSSIVAYFPFGEPLGSTQVLDFGGRGLSGSGRTATTNGQLGAGDGRPSTYCDGTNSFINFYSAGLNTNFDGAEGSAAILCKIDGAGIWTDSTVRDIFRIVSQTAGNNILVRRTATNNQLSIGQTAGGVAKSVTLTSLGGSLSFFHLGLTWSATDNQLKAYANGTQTGTTQTGLGTWAGALSPTGCLAGAASVTPGNVIKGWLQHLIIFNRPLNAVEMAELARI